MQKEILLKHSHSKGIHQYRKWIFPPISRTYLENHHLRKYISNSNQKHKKEEIMVHQPIMITHYSFIPCLTNYHHK